MRRGSILGIFFFNHCDQIYDKKQLKRGRAVLVYSSSWWDMRGSGAVRWWVTLHLQSGSKEVAGHIAPTIRKQRVDRK